MRTEGDRWIEWPFPTLINACNQRYRQKGLKRRGRKARKEKPKARGGGLAQRHAADSMRVCIVLCLKCRVRRCECASVSPQPSVWPTRVGLPDAKSESNAIALKENA